MKIPETILQEAAGYIDAVPGSKISYLGEYNGAEAYYVRIPNDVKVGYPPVFLLKGNIVTSIIGEEALMIIDELYKRARRARK